MACRGYTFDRPDPNSIHTDQLNAILHHTGLGDSSQLNHPRVAHNLLEYQPDYVSFIARSTSINWIGGKLPDWSARYKLFKRYGILNKKIHAKDKKRAGNVVTTQLQVPNPSASLVVAAEGGKHKRQKKCKAIKPTRSIL